MNGNDNRANGDDCNGKRRLDIKMLLITSAIIIGKFSTAACNHMRLYIVLDWSLLFCNTKIECKLLCFQ